MQSLFIFSTLFSVAAAQAQVEDKPKTCKTNCVLYLMAATDADFTYMSWCNDAGPRFCEKDAIDCRKSCQTNLNDMHHQNVDCNEVCKFTRRFSSEQSEKPVRQSEAVEEKPAEQSVSVQDKAKDCPSHCFLYLFGEYASGDVDYDYKSWCNDDGPQFCKMHTRDCMESCRLNLSGKSSKIDCNEVCKFTRAYSSEQKPAQKAVEEKPVERSLSVEEQKPVEEKPVEQSVSKKSHNCDLQCWAVLSDAISKGRMGKNYTYEWALHDCQEHLCHGPDSCRSGCYANFKVGSVDCNEVCKYADVRSTKQSEQKPAQKAVEEKPVERSLSGERMYPFSDCDLHCIAVLVSAREKGLIAQDWTDQILFKRCNENLCHGPGHCKIGCSDHFDRVDCNEVCKGADARNLSSIIV